MRNKQLATAGVALIIFGVLTGCGTGNGATLAAKGKSFSASVTNTSAGNSTSALANTSKTATSDVQMANIPKWFLEDVQMAEPVSLSTGANYILYYGSSPSFNVNSAMMNSWFGLYRGTGEAIDFGTNLQVVYRTLQNDPGQYGELSNIQVLEQTEQNKKLTGEVVPAVCVSVGNGDYLAFANNQVITASDNSGYIRYTVHSLKGVKTG